MGTSRTSEKVLNIDCQKESIILLNILIYFHFCNLLYPDNTTGYSPTDTKFLRLMLISMFENL